MNWGVFLFFLFGLSIGSFLNVLIHRLPKGENILGRSYCDHCRKSLNWYDLVPLLSFAILKGKCRFCKKRIDYGIPIVELITGFLFTAVYLRFPLTFDFQLWFYLLFISSLIVVFFTDLKYGIIPDKIIYPTLAVSFLFIGLNPNPLNFILSGIGAFLFFLILVLITKGRGMGGGDLKLASLLGLVLGFPNIVLSLYLAFLTGGVVSLILILWGKKRFRGDTIPFGPFLAISAIFTLFFGKQMVSLLLNFLL